MDFQNNFSVKLNTETKYQSLYQWCFQEFDAEGNQVGNDLVPFGDRQNFNVSNLRYNLNLGNSKNFSYSSTINDDFDEDVNEIKQIITVEHSEKIFADLSPSNNDRYQFRKTIYSMMGTDREIKDIQLSIEKSDANQCMIWGMVSQKMEVSDFRYITADDHIQITLFLTSEIFDKIIKLINSGIVNGANLSLIRPRGFYSEWHPEGSPSRVSILTNDYKNHGLEIGKECDIEPDSLGKVDKFELEFLKEQSLSISDVSGVIEADIDWARKRASSLITDEYPDYADLLQRTPRYEFLRQMLEEASIYSIKNKLSQDDLENLAEQISTFLNNLEDVFHRDIWADHKADADALGEFLSRSGELWTYPSVDSYKLKQVNMPYIDLSMLAWTAMQYLKLPVRNKSIDRMLVSAFVGTEYFSFAKSMSTVLMQGQSQSSSLRGLSTSPFFKPHPLWQFFKGLLWDFVGVVVIPLGALLGLDKYFIIQGDWPLWLGLGFILIWILSSLVGLNSLVNDWRSWIKSKMLIRELVEGMSDLYMEISNGQIVSAIRVRERLNNLNEKGAVWPTEVFPILDDIISRDGVM